MQIINKIMGFLGYVSKKDYDKQATLLKCYLDAMKKAVELKNAAISSLSLYKDIVFHVYDFLMFPEYAQEQNNKLRLFEIGEIEGDKLFEKLVEPCEKCKHARCICEITDEPIIGKRLVNKNKKSTEADNGRNVQ